MNANFLKDFFRKLINWEQKGNFKGTASQMTQHINKLAFSFKCYSLCD